MTEELMSEMAEVNAEREKVDSLFAQGTDDVEEDDDEDDEEEEEEEDSGDEADGGEIKSDGGDDEVLGVSFIEIKFVECVTCQDESLLLLLLLLLLILVFVLVLN